MARRERCDISDRSASEDRTDARLANDPIESSEQAEPIDPIDSTDPTDPIDKIDPREPMLRIESCERYDHNDPRDVTRTSCAAAGPPGDRAHCPMGRRLRHRRRRYLLVRVATVISETPLDMTLEV